METLLHCSWEYKLGWPLWKTVWRLLKKLKIELPCAALCLVTQLCSTLCDPMDCSPPGSSVHGFLQARYWRGLPCPPPGDLPNPGVKSGSPTLLADSLPSEPPGKPKNTGVSNLTLLQGVFLTHKSNWDLLHCRWILYQLSHKGSLRILEWVAYLFSRGSSRPIFTPLYILASFVKDKVSIGVLIYL